MWLYILKKNRLINLDTLAYIEEKAINGFSVKVFRETDENFLCLQLRDFEDLEGANAFIARLAKLLGAIEIDE